MYKFKDLTGYRFNRLLIIKRSKNDTYGRARFLCRCDCGTQKIISSRHLLAGSIVSCGCHRKESMRRRSITHGMSRTSIYKRWSEMLRRCNNPKDQKFSCYGGRGIKVCKRWHKFENFFKDMGHPPTPEYSIDRINNDGQYEPKNCKWSTAKEQRANQYHAS